MVNSSDQRARFKAGDNGSRVAKLFPRCDGPYKVISSHPAQSTYRLALPPSDKTHPVFHVSKLKVYQPNNPALFPNREPEQPPPVVVKGEEEFTIERIVEEWKVGRGSRGETSRPDMVWFQGGKGCKEQAPYAQVSQEEQGLGVGMGTEDRRIGG